MSSPLVSVIIPTYNRAAVLPRTLKSVLTQTYQNFEIFVVDDGSTEDIGLVVKMLNDSRIHHLRLHEHTNANVARNAGIRAATGEYIAMLDSDDEWLTQHLERRLQKIMEWGCDGIYGSFIRLGDDLRPCPRIARPRRDDESMPDYVLSGFVYAVTPSHFYRREAVLETLWDESLKRHQDYDFTIRFGTRFKFMCDPEPTVIVHWEKQVTRTFDFESRARFFEKYKDQLSPTAAVEYLFYQMYEAVFFKEPMATLAYYTGQLRALKIAINSRLNFFLSQHPHLYFWWRRHPAWHKFILAPRRAYNRCVIKQPN